VSTTRLSALTTYLDSLLRTSEIPDEAGAVNGLQVENSGEVSRIVAAVDASQATIDRAVEQGGPGTLILVHHGMLWEGNVPVAGRRYRRIRSLVEHDVALYAAHIPLDIHPELGNNVGLARELGIEVAGWFGEYRGILLGVHGAWSGSRDRLGARLQQVTGTVPRLIAGGPEQIQRVGIITGSGGSFVSGAARTGLDALITGEGAHHTYFDATEGGVNVYFAGHYATECIGVQQLARHLGEQFDVPWAFHDHPTGL